MTLAHSCDANIPTIVAQCYRHSDNEDDES